MDLKLKGKIALVTGSTAGIGFAIAEGLAAEGAHVYLNGRTQERVDRAIAAIKGKVANATLGGIASDFSGAAGAETVIAKLPTVDILVNNVGIFEPKPFAEIPDADWLRFFEVNVMSGVRLSRHYLPGMRQKNWGRILFISSESGVQIPAEMIHYGMTKTAQIAIARHCGNVGRNGCNREQHSPRPHGFGRRGWVCRGDVEATEQIKSGNRKGVLRTRTAFVSIAPLCHRGRGCIDGGLHGQRAFIGNERRGSARGRRRGQSNFVDDLLTRRSNR